MIDTTNMGRGEEIALIMKNLNGLYDPIDGDTYNEWHEMAIQNPKRLTQSQTIRILLAELRECLIALGEEEI